MNTLKLTLAMAACGLLLTSVGAQSLPTNGLVAYFPFDGNANDATGGGNDGTVVGATLTTNRFGCPGAAYSFNGTTTNRITFASSNLLVSYPFTCSFWMCYEGGAGNPRIVSWSGWEVNIGWPDLPRGLSYNNRTTTGLFDCRSSGVSFLGKWRHVVAIGTPAGMQLYVDGVLNNATDANGTIDYDRPGTEWLATLGGSCAVGYDNDLFSGQIDDVRLYDRALTPDEVATLYAIESTPPIAQPYLQITANFHLAIQGKTNIAGELATYTRPDLTDLNTQGLLKILAHDECQKGNWSSNGFPATATLELVNGWFYVLDGTNLLLNVSDLIAFKPGEPTVISGKQNLTSNLASPSIKKVQLVSVAFDDTAVENSYQLKFFLYGQMVETTEASKPVSGTYTVSKEFKLPFMVGDGYISTTPMSITGSMAGKGKAKLTVDN